MLDATLGCGRHPGRRSDARHECAAVGSSRRVRGTPAVLRTAHGRHRQSSLDYSAGEISCPTCASSLSRATSTTVAPVQVAPVQADVPHIVQVTPTSYSRDGVIGGGERIVLYLDEALRRSAASAGVSITTTVLALDGSAAIGSGRDRYQSVIGRAWDAHSLHAADLTARLRPADAIYVHQCMTEVGLFAAAHGRLLGKRVYGSDAGGGEARLLEYNPDAMAVYHAVHALSAFAASAFEGLPVRVHVIPGPVDTAVHRPPSDGAAPRDPRLVVSVGRILPHKGCERTIRALPDGMSLVLAGQHYDQDYLSFLRRAAIGKDVRFVDGLDDAQVRALLHRAGTFVHASSHVDYAGRFFSKPELLGLAPLEALCCGAPTLVSDAGSLPELGALPGCRVFRDEAELSSMLREAASSTTPPPDPAAMHAAVEAAYGPGKVGTGLLAMMEIAPLCAS